MPLRRGQKRTARTAMNAATKAAMYGKRKPKAGASLSSYRKKMSLEPKKLKMSY